MANKLDACFDVIDAIDIIENVIDKCIQLETKNDENFLKFFIIFFILLVLCTLMAISIDYSHISVFLTLLPLTLIALYMAFDKLRTILKIKALIRTEKRHIKVDAEKVNPFIIECLNDEKVSPLKKIIVEAKKEYLYSNLEFILVLRNNVCN